MPTSSEVRACSVAEIFAHPSFPALWAEAAAECANPELSPVHPDEEFYQLLEKSGAARCFRCGNGDELAGFAVLLIAPSGANGCMYATVERLFVSREARTTGAGGLMMSTLNQAAAAAGCEAIFYTAHAGSRLAKLLFLSSDLYTLANCVFCRRLK